MRWIGVMFKGTVAGTRVDILLLRMNVSRNSLARTRLELPEPLKA
jgi:hypothetical protein